MAEEATAEVVTEPFELIEVHANSGLVDGDGNKVLDDEGNQIVYTGVDSHYVFNPDAPNALKIAVETLTEESGAGEPLRLINAQLKGEGYTRALTSARSQHPTKLGKRTAKAVESGFAAIEEDLTPEERAVAATIAAKIAAKVAG